MKHCFKCGVLKTITNFYSHPQMKDGHLNKCIDCTKKDVAKRCLEKLKDPEWVKNERERCREKQDRYRKLGLAKQSSYAVKKKHTQKFPDKSRARSKASKAKNKGLLIRPLACQKCGKQTELEMHHPDYSKPLSVEWLCTKCHGITRRLDQ